MKRRSYALIIAVLAAALPVCAAEHTLRLDADKTRVGFTLGATAHTVRGTLVLSAGEIQFDPASGIASGEVLFDARRTETGNAKRDKKMHAKVLESEEYPHIVFMPERVEGELAETGHSEITVHGSVLIHGDEHPVELKANILRDGDRVSGTFSFTVPFVAWGMRDPSMFVLRVAKEVEVTVELQGSLE